MSTNYIFQPPVKEQDFLREAGLYGYERRDNLGDKPGQYAIVGDGTYIWISEHNGIIKFADTYAFNDGSILYTIAEGLNVKVYSEHDEGYDEVFDRV
jgi:hypothetical protein